MVIDSLPQAEYQSTNQGFPWNLELVAQARTIAVMLDSLGNGFYFNFCLHFFRVACHLALLPRLLTSDVFVFLYSLFFCSCIPLWIPTISSLQTLGQDGSCSICTAQYSGGLGLFSALLIHSIKTLGLVTGQGGQYWQEMRPLLASCRLCTTLHQSERKKSKMDRMCARKELKQCPSEWKASRWLW